MKKTLILIFITICLLSALSACGQTGSESQAEAETNTASSEQVISGIVNRLDDYLVLLDSNEQYHTFDFGEDIDPASLEEGDSVTVTYTGTLDSEDPYPVAVSITKED